MAQKDKAQKDKARKDKKSGKKSDPKKSSPKKSNKKRDPGPSVKDNELDERLRDEGSSKKKSARIANAAANTSRSAVAKKGGKAPAYEDWKVTDLRERAKEVGITGRSSMKKKDLVSALRNS